MKCKRCHKETDFFYTAGDVVLCENCACNSVAVLSDEGFFPFTDNVAAYQSWGEPAAETAVEEPVPTEETAGEEEYASKKAVLNSVYGMKVEYPAMSVEEVRRRYPFTPLSDEEIQNLLDGKNPDGTENKNIDPYWEEKYQ